MSYRDMYVQATGHEPYEYQRRLAEASQLPLALQVGTGMGKTSAAVLAWLWRRRFADVAVRDHTPRRLVYCLPQRTLVQQTEAAVREWLQRLDVLEDHALDGTGMRSSGGEASRAIPVYVLMGGEIANDWDARPEQDMVIVGTQDQLLSRALNRGYAMSRYRWPMHFALLNSDCLWIIDEPQLFGPSGLATTAQLQAFREFYGTFGETQTLWMSATLRREWLETIDFAARAAGGEFLELADADLAQAQHRLEAKKPIHRSPLVVTKESVTAKGMQEYSKRLAEWVLSRHQSGTMTIVICNRVNRAQAVYKACRKLAGAEQSMLLLHSRFRSVDRDVAQSTVRTMTGKDMIVIATQAIEAGIDISAETLITEMASWASLVQRFGRCNRDGNASEPAVYIIDLEAEPETCAPYDPQEIAASRRLVEGLHDVGVLRLPPVTDTITHWHVVRKRDVISLFDTAPDLSGLDIDVSPYIRDTDDADVEVYWRNWPEDRPTDKQLRPASQEICRASMSMFRDYLLKKNKDLSRTAWTWNALDEQWIQVEVRAAYPGQLLMLRAAHGGYSPEIGFVADDWSPVPMAGVFGGQVENEGHDRDNDNLRGVAESGPVTLADHLEHVVSAASELRDEFDVPLLSLVVEAARYHDTGKRHPVFQSKLKAQMTPDSPHWDVFLAKGQRAPSLTNAARVTVAVGSGAARQDSPPADEGADAQHQERAPDINHSTTSVHADSVRRRSGRGFRHELASALAYLQQHQSTKNDFDTRLVAYLVAAHHGKVRMSIRSLPKEQIPISGKQKQGVNPLFARGVWDGDELEQMQLNDGSTVPTVRLSLDIMQIGSSAQRVDEESRGERTESWLEGTVKLLQGLGPYRLAWLETMLRVADWRASFREVLNSGKSQRDQAARL